MEEKEKKNANKKSAQCSDFFLTCCYILHSDVPETPEPAKASTRLSSLNFLRNSALDVLNLHAKQTDVREVGNAEIIVNSSQCFLSPARLQPLSFGLKGKQIVSH